jgi:hypothetical protein
MNRRLTSACDAGQGGPKRIKHTLVPLVFRAIMLARTIKQVHTLKARQPRKGLDGPSPLDIKHEPVVAL